MLLQTVDTAQTADINRAIEEKTAENNQLGQQISRQLKGLTEETLDLEKKKEITPSVARIRFNMASTSSNNFARQIQAFQSVEVKAKAVYGEQMKRQYLIVNPTATPAQLEEVASGQEVAGMFESANRMEAQQALDKLKDRHRMLQKLEKSLLDLHRLFVDPCGLLRPAAGKNDRQD